MALSNRRPWIRFRPLHAETEPQQRYAVYWNGSRASNGDGVADGGPVEYAAPIIGPAPVFETGLIYVYGGGWALGGWGVSHSQTDVARGWGRGPWGLGEWSYGARAVAVQFPFNLRNGQYSIGVVMRDSVGNEADPPGDIVVFTITAPPRPVGRVAITAYDDQADTLSIEWSPSADFV